MAITAMTAAQLAGASFMETSVRAMKLAFIGLFVPYVFILNPTLLEFPKFSVNQTTSFGATLVGLVALCAAWWGWLARPLAMGSRTLAGIGGIACLAWAAL